MKMKFRFKKHSLKVLSILISVFLWAYVLNSEKVKFEKTVVIEYILPDDMMFTDRPMHEVIFMIEGPRAFVRTVLEKEDKIIVDLTLPHHRKHLHFAIDINPSQLNLPFGMLVEKVIPKKIPIRLEKKASKIVPVRPQFAGSLPEQMSITKAEVYPSEIEITGPRTVISKLKEVQTRPIELDGLMGLSEVPVQIQFSDDRLSMQPGLDLKLTYQLKAGGANMVLERVPIRFLTKNKNVRSVSKTVTLRLMVPPKIKDRSNISSTIQVWADIPEGSRGKIEVPLKSIVPPGIHLLEISPKSIIVNVQ
ncbi:MAG TPA: CdaR family protein [Bacteriovoracaceae bacterium]|nr:CdaR family protein [Bacteriovoracaceae bacterium]